MKTKIIKMGALFALSVSALSLLGSCGGTSDNSDVVWDGLEEAFLNMGDENPTEEALLKGVTATTEKGKELTVKVDLEQSDTIDTLYAGSYTVYYFAYDGETQVSEERGGYESKTWTVVRGTFIDNWDFSIAQGQPGWGNWAGNGNAGSVMSWELDATNSQLVMDIKNSGNEYWQNQCEFKGLTLEGGFSYKLTVTAKSDHGRTIGASLQDLNNGYALIDEWRDSAGFATTADFADYNFYFTPEQDYDNIKLGILAGRFNEKDDVEDRLYIDKVKVTKLDKKVNSTGIVFTGNTNEKVKTFAEYQELAPVTAVDKDGKPVELKQVAAVQTVEFPETLSKAVFAERWEYVDAEGNISYFIRQIEYVPTAPEKAFPHELVDPELEYGKKYYAFEENGIITTEAKGGEFIIKSALESTNEADWRAQVMQKGDIPNGYTFEEGKTYKMVVKAKIDNINVTTLRMEFCASMGGGKTDMVFDKADTYQTFESAPYTYTGGDIKNSRATLLLAEYKEAYTLTVDSMQIVEVVTEEREHEYDLRNDSFTNGLEFWKAETENGFVAINENKDAGTVTVKSTTETGTEPNLCWQAQLQQSGTGVITRGGKVYQIEMRCKVSDPTVNGLLFETRGDQNRSPMVFENTTDWQVIKSQEYTFADDNLNTDVRLLLATFDKAFELEIDYIRLVEIVK